MLAQEKCKSTERDWQTFLFDQATSLDESPFCRRDDEVSFAKRKFVQRDPGSLDFDFSFRTTQMNDCTPQRFRTNKDERDCTEHLPRGFAISRLVHIHGHIGAVKRNNRRLLPRENQRQQMNGDLAKVNVQQASIGLAQNAL
jgi:hypothetical protein